MILIAIDPGKTTGYLSIDCSDNKILLHDEIDSWFKVCTTLERELTSYVDVRVVVEKFIINQGTAKKTNQEEPRDIIGAVKFLTYKHTGYLPKQQSAAEAKTFSTNEKLKRAGLWYVGGEGHANDASRHALVYMVNHSLLDPSILLP